MHLHQQLQVTTRARPPERSYQNAVEEEAGRAELEKFRDRAGSLLPPFSSPSSTPTQMTFQSTQKLSTSKADS